MKLKLVLLCAGLLALGAVGGYAAIPSSNGTITGCVSATGDLKVIDAESGAVCGKSKKTLTWNQQGPQGSPGLLNVHVATAWGTLNTQTAKYSFVICDPGEIVLGGGAKAFTIGPNGEYNPEQVAIAQSYPTGAGESIQGWAAFANETEQPFDVQWRLRVYAICGTLAA
jgi:hypothetical protein